MIAMAIAAASAKHIYARLSFDDFMKDTPHAQRIFALLGATHVPDEKKNELGTESKDWVNGSGGSGRFRKDSSKNVRL
jgi:hypothetical protein